MAYDQILAERLGVALANETDVREVKMFGGLTFMVNGKMTVVANAHGELMVRCNPNKVDDLLQKTSARWPEMHGKPMSRGWVVVENSALETDEALQFWVYEALEQNKKESK